MNNNLILISNVSKTYKLTQEQINLLTNKYQTDTREQSIIEKELNDLCDYYRLQNKINKAINEASPLKEGKNYYVTAFDKSSNIYLQPVSINVTNAETNEVMIDNSFKGYQKHTSVDDIEIAICQLGKSLGFNIVEEYRLYNSEKQKDSIVIKDIINEDEFYDVENLKKRFNKLINSGRLKKEAWVDASNNLKTANTKEDYKAAINFGIKILKSLPSMREEDYQELEEKYFEMLIFDSIINQSERNFKDYGILCNKETKRYSFAPLFDNVFPTIVKNNDVFSFNDIICNRYELTECLFYNYYDKIDKKVEFILNNKEKIIKTASTIFKYNVDINTYNMLMKNIITNINYFQKIIETKKLEEQNNNSNAGYVNIIQLVIALVIILLFSVGIAYLLYNIR